MAASSSLESWRLKHLPGDASERPTRIRLKLLGIVATEAASTAGFSGELPIRLKLLGIVATEAAEVLDGATQALARLKLLGIVATEARRLCRLW